LIVPGHDNEFSGTAHGGLREADLNLDLARELELLFAADDNFRVTVVRDLKTGEYLSRLRRYFKREAGAIQKFIDRQKSRFERRLANGALTDYAGVPHNAANPTVAARLYGINKWADEQKFDLVLHVHFNDYAGRGSGLGLYRGFSIYVPERQLPNSRVSEALALPLAAQLLAVARPSNFPGEGAIVSDQELIALGANATLKTASLLIEYGYIYEERLQSPAVRALWLQALARQTYAGLLDYLDAER
jgi:N-acetylmuramoyl-L-alanine amidase